MRISAKGEYAIRAVLDLAMHHGRGLIPIQEIAARQRIPQRYLEQVLLALRRSGVLTSKRGSSGGYHLTRAPDAITVGAVLRAVEGRDAPLEALTRERTSGDANDLRELWDEISEAVSRVIDHLSFGELAARAHDRRESARPMYHI
ncbi:MAG: Rrf2 family transcriptional regulator [Candidatus Rokubacteria bacterium]|nr:Rrf2 family transcriptional regulator [Candidatus Rokubacteria bacterium]